VEHALAKRSPVIIPMSCPENWMDKYMLEFFAILATPLNSAEVWVNFFSPPHAVEDF